MLVEVAERVGPSIDAWIARPFAYLLWTYFHLQELDFRRSWLSRADAIQNAWLAARAFHDPDSLKSEQQAHLASASGEAADEQALNKGLAMLAEFERGNTLDGLTYRTELPPKR